MSTFILFFAMVAKDASVALFKGIGYALLSVTLIIALAFLVCGVGFVGQFIISLIFGDYLTAKKDVDFFALYLGTGMFTLMGMGLLILVLAKSIPVFEYFSDKWREATYRRNRLVKEKA